MIQDGKGGQDSRERLLRLSEACLSISDGLELGRVLPEVVSSACFLTNARYGAITTSDDSARMKDFHTSGLTPEESRLLADMPGGWEVFQYLSGLKEPLRVSNITSHIRSLGLPDLRLPVEVSFILTAPIKCRDLAVGNLYLGRHDEDGAFTHEDEEVLVIFASLAALVISNARIYGKEWRARADFLGMVSHELRTPLTSIKGSATTALESYYPMHPEEARQAFRIINDQADRMRGLINDLLDITQIEAGSLSVTPQPTSAASLVEQARISVLSGGITNAIEVDIPTGLPPVKADPQRMVQVLCNLLSNASRNSPADSIIRISARQEKVHVVLSVEDEGIGISSDRLRQLFSGFPRRGGGDYNASQVMGLGLAVCKGIVEAHGGEIWAESDGLNLGARFSFTIPVSDITEVRADRGAVDGEQKGHQERILAIDDDPLALRQVREILSAAGYATTITGDPGALVQLVLADEPELVLMDLMFPDADGVDLMQSIGEVSDAPVIFLSAYGKGQYLARAFEMGAADYIVKPFSPTELLARIRAALRRRRDPAAANCPEPYRLGDLEIDYSERLVTIAGTPVRLTATEYALLTELSANAGRVQTYSQLLQRVWGIWTSHDPRLVRSFIKKLRRKLGDDARNPTYILTESGVGYRMAKPSAD